MATKISNTQVVNGKKYTDPLYDQEQKKNVAVQNQINKGVFVNQSTGLKTDQFGKEIKPAIPVETPYLTPEQGAKPLVESDMQDQASFEKELFGESKSPQTIEQAINQLKDQQKQYRDYVTNQQQTAGQLEQSQLSQTKNQGESAIESIKASYAQSPEGPVSSTAPQIVTQFTTNIQRQITDAQTRVQAAQAQRAEALRQLTEAEKNQDIEAAKMFRSQIAKAEQSIRESEVALIDAQGKAVQTAIDLQKSNLDVQKFASDEKYREFQIANTKTETISKNIGLMGSAAESLTYDQLAKMIEGTDMTMPQVLALKEAAIIEGKANNTKNELEAEKLRLQAEDLRKTAGKTQGQLEYEFFSTLDQAGQSKYIELKRANPNLQFSQMDDGSIVSMNPANGQAQVVYTPNKGGIPNEAPIQATIGTKVVTAQPVLLSVLQQADAEMFAETGKHIQINESFRSPQRQIDIRKKFGYTSDSQASGEGGLPMAAPPGTSFHEKGLAVDVANWQEAEKYLKKYGVVNGIKNDMGHFSMGELNPEVFATNNDAKSIAENIMSGTSTQTLKDLPQKQRAAVDAELNKLKQQALNSGDIYGVMQSSAGGAPAGDAFKKSFTKAATVIDQVTSLADLLSKKDGKMTASDGSIIDISPLTGWLRGKNPWDTNAQTVQSILSQTVPNLARGIYGEVGVLTDNDIALYTKTLPNLTQTDQVKQAVLALTLKSIKHSLENQVEVEAGTGTDMSGLISSYKKLDEKIRSLEGNLGIESEDSNPWGTIDTVRPDDILNQF